MTDLPPVIGSDDFVAATASRVALWIVLRLPSGAGWRYSRFHVLRAIGGWWLPRWYGIGIGLEDKR